MEFLETEFFQFAVILSVAAGLGAIGILLRQPLIVTFIGVGIVVGPAGLDIMEADEQVALLARMGIAILLFLVGLRLDLHALRTMGPVALATGLGQVLFTSIVGFAICLGLGLSAIPALYVAVALTFSSTIIVVKLLSDKREIDALHGRIAVGFLIVQDIVVILVMIALAALGGPTAEDNPLTAGLLIAGKGLLMLAAIGLLMKFVLPKLTHWLARSQELLILFAVAWAMLLSAVAAYVDFSEEVGAFLAGVSLASTHFRESIGARLVSLRDFLLVFFFIDLGAGLDLSRVAGQAGPALLLSLFVLVGNPLIVMIIMGAMGYRRRTSFLAGLTVAQISEFSLILASMGKTLGHVTEDVMAMITLVGLITIALSTYMILYSHPLYERIAPWLTLFERTIPYRERSTDSPDSGGADVIVCGLGRYGHHLASFLRKRHVSLLGIDFDPHVVAGWQKRGHAAQYGDVEDPELAATLPLSQAQWVVCTAPQRQTNLGLLQALREHGYSGRIALSAHHAHDGDALRAAGADLVLMPFIDAARDAADTLLELTPPPADDEEPRPAGGEPGP